MKVAFTHSLALRSPNLPFTLRTMTGFTRQIRTPGRLDLNSGRVFRSSKFPSKTIRGISPKGNLGLRKTPAVIDYQAAFSCQSVHLQDHARHVDIQTNQESRHQ